MTPNNPHYSARDKSVKMKVIYAITQNYTSYDICANKEADISSSEIKKKMYIDLSFRMNFVIL